MGRELRRWIREEQGDEGEWMRTWRRGAGRGMEAVEDRGERSCGWGIEERRSEWGMEENGRGGGIEQRRRGGEWRRGGGGGGWK